MNSGPASSAAQGTTLLSIGWIPTSSDGADFASAEAANAAQRPLLTIVYGDPGGPGPEEHPVYNRSALIYDHIVYSSNRVEVLDPLARLILDPPSDPHGLALRGLDGDRRHHGELEGLAVARALGRRRLAHPCPDHVGRLAGGTGAGRDVQLLNLVFDLSLTSAAGDASTLNAADAAAIAATHGSGQLRLLGRRGELQAIDALAKDGFRFPAAVAPAPLTFPSHAALHTGFLPRRLGLRDNGQVLGPAPATLAEVLGGSGVPVYVFRPCIVGGPESILLVKSMPYVRAGQALRPERQSPRVERAVPPPIDVVFA